MFTFGNFRSADFVADPVDPIVVFMPEVLCAHTSGAMCPRWVELDGCPAGQHVVNVSSVGRDPEKGERMQMIAPSPIWQSFCETVRLLANRLSPSIHAAQGSSAAIAA